MNWCNLFRIKHVSFMTALEHGLEIPDLLTEVLALGYST